MGIRLKPSSRARFDRKMSRLRKFAQQDAPAAQKTVAIETIARMKKDAPVDTGTLQNSIGLEIVGNTTEITVNADYGVEVEYGTRYTKPRPYFRNNVRLAKQELRRRLISKIRQT